jgi:hypothetical protein
MINNKLIAEILGWYGAVVILVAYLLASINIIVIDSYLFQFMNLTGAMGIVAISIVKKVHQSTVLNALWAAIALFAIINIAFGS